MPIVAVALAAGVLGAIQPEVNAELGSRLGSALVASLVNFAIALAVTAVVVGFRPGTQARLRRARSWPVPRWTLTAGFGGAVVVLAGAVAVDTIGVAIFSVAFFAGQITFGLLVDRLGVSPGGVRPLTAPRVQAVVLAAAAVVLAHAGQPVGEFAPGLVAFSVAAGAAVALQSAFNGRIASVTGDAVAATAVNVTVGTVALAVIVGALGAAGELGALHWPGEPWLYSGGALGAAIVLSLAAASAALGVLRATLTMLGAQLLAAFVVDWAVRGDAPTPGVVAGGVLIVVAVARVGRRAPVARAQAG
jgi:transporter family-2 protein